VDAVNPNTWSPLRTDFIRPRLTAAFRALRRQGFIARQNYACCSSCAAHRLAKDVLGFTPTKLMKLQGAVYYHRQDADALLHAYLSGRLHLRYGQVHVTDDSNTLHRYGLETIMVGEAVHHALEAADLTVAWDYTPNTAIQVTGINPKLLDAAEAACRLHGNLAGYALLCAQADNKTNP
jgi:hypothetical protein